MSFRVFVRVIRVPDKKLCLYSVVLGNRAAQV